MFQIKPENQKNICQSGPPLCHNLWKSCLIFKWPTFNPPKIRICGLSGSWKVNYFPKESASVSSKWEARHAAKLFCKNPIHRRVRDKIEVFTVVHANTFTWYQLSQSSHWAAFCLFLLPLLHRKHGSFTGSGFKLTYPGNDIKDAQSNAFSIWSLGNAFKHDGRDGPRCRWCVRAISENETTVRKVPIYLKCREQKNNYDNFAEWQLA